jgi:hypothetical protein
MTDRWTERLSEYLDGELPELERQAMEQHLFACAECATALDELRRVVARAHALEDAPPAPDLWPAIAERIAQVPERDRDLDLVARRRARERRFSVSLPQLAAAVIALMIASAAAVRLLDRNHASSGVAVVQPPAAGVPQSTSEQPAGTSVNPVSTAGVSGYDAAVADLEGALKEGRGRLAPETLRVLEKNLQTIDQALSEARSALERDPGSVYLHDYVARTMRRKLELLRQANEIASART